jgi:hypothetical protein
MLGEHDFSAVDCLYLIIGRAKPTEAEMDAECAQMAAFMGNPRKPRRAVYLSSLGSNRAKRDCEGMLGPLGERGFIIRPGAVFGPSQDPLSEMLIPSLARDENLTLRTPELNTQFVSVYDLVRFLQQCADPEWFPFDCWDVPGTFTMTPLQMRALWRTWNGYHAQEGWEHR